MLLISYILNIDAVGRVAENAMLLAAGSKNTGLARSLTGDVKPDFLVGTHDVSAGWKRDGINTRLYGRDAQRRSGAISLIACLYRRVFFWDF